METDVWASPPPVFLGKSVDLFKNKRVEFLENAKTCKRVWKSMKTKEKT
jgi:hypothetical protein